MIDDNVNLNHSDCLRTVMNFGEQVVHNICTGKVQHIPWGSADWFLAVFGAALATVALLMFATMIRGFWRL